MELLNGVTLILSLLWVGGTSELQLCQYGQTTTHHTNINMNSTTISGSTGMCSCSIQLNNDARITMFPDLNIPGCRIRVSVSDSSFDFTCSNEKISSSYYEDKKAWDVLWLFVISTDESLPMSGNLQVKTNQPGAKISIECFSPNKNTSLITTTPNTSIPTPEIQSSMTSKTTDANVSLFERSTVSISGSNAPNVSPTANKERRLPAAAIAGVIAGSVIVLVIIVTGSVILYRRYHRNRRTEDDQIPEYRDHPTYCDLTNRANADYEHIDNVKGPKKIYQNVDLDMNA